jgi:hypothetical protein
MVTPVLTPCYGASVLTPFYGNTSTYTVLCSTLLFYLMVSQYNTDSIQYCLNTILSLGKTNTANIPERVKQRVGTTMAAMAVDWVCWRCWLEMWTLGCLPLLGWWRKSRSRCQCAWCSLSERACVRACVVTCSYNLTCMS